MGLAGGLVKRVFSKSRNSHDGNRRNLGGEKSRWSSVRIYICGDEFNSHPEDDLASYDGSATHPTDECYGQESNSVEKAEELEEFVVDDSVTDFVRENAAIHIQSAFRGFLARQEYEWIRQSATEDQTDQVLENASKMSEAVSTEVQIGDPTESLRAEDESLILHHRVLHKSRSQAYRAKEDWDDSTVDSNMKKLRMQNRLEATTRRERALAYAFSQQLRVCPTKKRSSESGSTETNMGWTWLERWMATRMQENPLVDDCMSKHLDPMSTVTERRSMLVRKRFDIAVIEKESCGSNDVSVNFDNSSNPETPKDGYGPVRNRLKVAEDASRTRLLPDYHKMQRLKVSKKVSLREAAKGKVCKQRQPKSVEETEGEVFSDHHQTTEITNVY